ncbi:cyclin-dependent kinase 20 isoform X3 [Chelonia mydas]|uniref:cyclin-dependent kinase 20 isoform X3 n=1 Tax=Chelonia mydas TaxID=8469 RepID=UPI001CA8A53A|nr:cyclin-dependent kinase 20 isoform X3 [Chelonia mydas]
MGRERDPPQYPTMHCRCPRNWGGGCLEQCIVGRERGYPPRYGVPVQTSQPSMDQYSILGRIGEGAHGIVFKAKNIESGETVALKKVALRRLEDGIPNQALREIKALQEIEENQHVVKLKAMFPHGAGFVLVFEYMLSDLAEVIRNAQQPLTQAQVKGYMLMLLQGVAFCHANNIMHRDLKPANLLISSAGQLKIADFGLARVFSSDAGRLYSHQVATRWYRAPELLYGARKYDEGVDLWAVGCIFAELLNNSPLFPGENDIEQLCCVLRVLGTPSQRVWPEITELPDYNKISFKDNPPIPLEEVLPDAPPQALQLLKRFLVYPSRERVRAAQGNVVREMGLEEDFGPPAHSRQGRAGQDRTDDAVGRG